ncbi:hypothetical protein Tco_0653302 [Tanacetum coccineum]|uniref:Uncharacterized protein n=1 Tax=Tanacetum coccineum TaxID=301880 RepID=A0ABQ4X0A4_9ASTR
MPTEMELTLEQTQQGVSYEVLSWNPVTLCSTLLAIKVFIEFVSFVMDITRISINFLTPSELILKRFNTTAGNSVKKILLKLNLSDHRSILTDSKEHVKMVVERQSVKVKEIQERCIIKAFQDYKIKKGMSMSVQKSQVHEMAKFTRWQNEIMLG